MRRISWRFSRPGLVLLFFSQSGSFRTCPHRTSHEPTAHMQCVHRGVSLEEKDAFRSVLETSATVTIVSGYAAVRAS